MTASAGAADPIRIGLFVPGRGTSGGGGTEVRRGAEIAIDAANRERGVRGRQVSLVSAPSDLPWGGAASALVHLVHEEHAVAVIGGLDARTAHLAEQIVARARGASIFVTPWASEEALTRLRIPWFFSVVPDDRRQARTLASEIFAARGIARAAAWVEESLDARSAAEAFLGAAPAGSVSVFRSSTPGVRDDLASRMAKNEFGALVLFASPREASRLVHELRERGEGLPIFGTLALAASDFVGGAGAAAEGVVLLAPAGIEAPAGGSFREAYRSAYGKEPEAAAFYGHDAAAALIEALRRSPPGSVASLTESLAATEMEGVTGTVRFDARRGRDGDLSLAVVRSGRLILQQDGTAAGSARGKIP